MISLYICLATMAVMVGTSFKARGHFTPDECIPMQWGISGEVNWSARRDIAIWIIPAIAFVTIAFCFGIVAISGILDHIAGYAVLGLNGVMLIIIHAGHLYFARKSLDKST